MKRSILDITKGLYRSNNRIKLQPFDLSNSEYYIYKTDSYKFPNVLYEMSDVNPKEPIRVTINNVFISNDDFIIENDSASITIKFLKNRMTYELDEKDTIILNGAVY